VYAIGPKISQNKKTWGKTGKKAQETKTFLWLQNICMTIKSVQSFAWALLLSCSPETVKYKSGIMLKILKTRVSFSFIPLLKRVHPLPT